MPNPSPSLAIVGGGLSGLAAAEAASRCGLRVDLFESRRALGGRAGAFRDPASGQVLDACQHLALGCCTNLAEFCRRTGIDDCFERHRRLHFLDRQGRRYDFGGTHWLPAPLHLLPGLLRLGYLTLGQRTAIVRTMLRLARLPIAAAAPCADAWLRAERQSAEAIDCFWSPILVSALGDGLDRVSLSAARKVVRDGLLASRHAYELELPRLPLAELWDRRVASCLTARGVVVHRGVAVGQIDATAGRASAVVLTDGTRRAFDFVIAAVSWRRIARLLGPALRQAIPGLDRVHEIRPAPITAVHLWFDRPVSRLPHAVLLGRLGQWMFRPAWAENSAATPAHGHYCQVVISGSQGLVGVPRHELLQRVSAELCAAWPEARDAQLLRGRVLTQPAAVFSCVPGLEALRPPQRTPIPNLLLCGDWTATGWPSTMEGAVRSGYLAVESLLGSLGKARRLLVPELPQDALARWLLGTDRG